MNEIPDLPDPADTAQLLIENGMSAEEYEELQVARRTRIETFKQHNIAFLVHEAQTLYQYGEKVLAIMRLNQKS